MKWISSLVLVSIVILAAGGCGVSTADDEHASAEGRLGKVSSALVSVSTDAVSYPVAGTVNVTFGGATSHPRDWVALGQVGSSQWVRWTYTQGAPAGTIPLGLPSSARGLYEARFYSFQAGDALMAVSAPFSVGPRVTTDRTTYAPSDSIAVQYEHALPGNGLDWLAIAPVGGSAQSYVRWAYTGGPASGSQTFPVGSVPAGTYEARLYGYNDELQAASAPFTISGRSLASDKSSYVAGASATFTFAGAVGSGTDWVAIIPEGAADSSYVRWQYTSQQTSGAVAISLNGVAAGSYVAKLFANNTYELQASSNSFSVGSSSSYSLAVEKDNYVGTESARFNFVSAPPTALDWLAVAPVGAPPSGYVRWQYTGGAAEGQLTIALTDLPSGSYEGRLYANNTLDLRATTAPFQVSAFRVEADKATYARTDAARIGFTASPATSTDWIALTPEGAPANGYVKWAYTGGGSSGILEFPLSEVPAGTYRANLYANNTFELRATSATFTVGGIAVSTTKALYTDRESVTVSFAGLPGNVYDWIAITTPNANPGAFVQWSYTYGQSSGTRTFQVPLGTYVARLHVDNGTAIAAQSSSFSIVPAVAVTSGANLGTTILNGVYSVQLSASAGVIPYTWSLAPGASLPPGLSLSTDGRLSGSPTQEGSFTFPIDVTDASLQSAQRTFTLTVLDFAPRPALATISPTSAPFLSQSVTLTVTGTGFTSRSVVYLGNNSPLTTTFVSSTELTAVIPASLLDRVTSYAVTVYNSPPAGGTSNTETFFVTPPPPP